MKEIWVLMYESLTFEVKKMKFGVVCDHCIILKIKRKTLKDSLSN